MLLLFIYGAQAQVLLRAYYLGMKNKWVVLAGLILLCEAVGAVGGFATAGNIQSWYAGLVKPSFNPPDWLFGPVWTLLYLMMAVAAWLIYRSADTPERSRGLQFWGLQLVLNAVWAPVFFALHDKLFALGIILLLDLAVVFTVVVFRRVNGAASTIMLPYLAWILFATTLNEELWRLNR